MNTKKKINRPSKKFKNKANQKQKNNRNKSSINPNKLVQGAQESNTRSYTPISNFEEWDTHPGIKANLKEMGFVYPTEIQERTYDKLMAKTDLIGIANTGTGKTGAFLIPILQRLLKNDGQKFQSLIVVPTRELALQVQDEFRKLAKGLGFNSACFIGGTNLTTDINRSRNYNDIIIGTPGRLLDLMQRGNLKLHKTETLVLDEYDRMLDMGFIQDIRKIVKAMNQRKHTMLFSATMDPKQKSLIEEMVKSPVLVEVDSGDTTSKNVAQDIIRVPEGGDKYGMLLKLLSGSGFDKVILFAETKRLADRLSKKLNKSGIKTDQIHGNKSQNYRVKALSKFKNGSIKILVATDVAARGVDICDVSHVINYQLPRDFDTYIHRIGRTGRAGKTGMAYTFVD